MRRSSAISGCLWGSSPKDLIQLRKTKAIFNSEGTSLDAIYQDLEG